MPGIVTGVKVLIVIGLQVHDIKSPASHRKGESANGRYNYNVEANQANIIGSSPTWASKMAVPC